MLYGAPPGTGGMYWVASASEAGAGGWVWARNWVASAGLSGGRPPGAGPAGTGAMYCVASASAPPTAPGTTSGGNGCAYGWGRGCPWGCCPYDGSWPY